MKFFALLTLFCLVTAAAEAKQFQYVTQIGTGTSPWMEVSGAAPTSQQVDVTGTANYTVQTTNDPIGSTSTQVAFNHPDTANMVNNTVSAQSNLQSPVNAFRIVVNSGTGTVKLIVVKPDASTN
jgi:hypothetical protein